MSIDWSHFTPWSALAGGLLIGIAAALFAVLNGRAAGISGIVGGALGSVRGDRLWRLAFVGGLLAAPLAWTRLADLPGLRIDAGYIELTIAGLLVGVGTRYAGGCTTVAMVCAAWRGSRCVRWWRR